MLAQPLAVNVSGSYNTVTMDELALAGNVSLLDTNSMISFNVKLNTSSEPVSVREIDLTGNFPYPLDFIEYTGVYRSECSCATLRNTAPVQAYVTVKISTDLVFSPNEHPSITELKIDVLFHRPVNLRLSGVYRYSSDNTSSVTLYGEFNITQMTMLTTELKLLLEGNSYTLTALRFNGTFPSPLALDVYGEYSVGSNDLHFTGSLMYDFAQLNASL